MSHEEKVNLVEKDFPNLSLARQTELLDIARSSLYYQPKINETDFLIMNKIDEIYTQYPFYGSRRVKYELENYEIVICREHVQRLMRLMGIEAIYPKKRFNTSQSDTDHRLYPYLLRNLEIVKPDQVWGTDITYIRLENGFVYLVALIDWFSRYVVSWELSPALEVDFCLRALNEAITVGLPEIHNSDQGKQFTSHEYTKILETKNIQISMDGRGRCMDNIFTERLWRTVKYENVFLNSYRNISEARKGLNDYFQFYNKKRRHQSLGYQTPETVYWKK